MNPLEKMSRARWARVAVSQVKPFDELPESVRRNMMEDDRAALLALAETELPQEVLTITGPAGCHVDMDHRRCIFRIIVRAIAETQS